MGRALLFYLLFVALPILLYLPARNRRAMWSIKEGMAEWTRKTCIRFKERSNEGAFAYFVPGGG